MSRTYSPPRWIVFFLPPHLTLEIEGSGASPSPFFFFLPSESINRFPNDPLIPCLCEDPLYFPPFLFLPPFLLFSPA